VGKGRDKKGIAPGPQGVLSVSMLPNSAV